MPRHVAILGASSGIGEQLALAYAPDADRLSLAARRLAKLDSVADRCRGRGGIVATDRVDVRDAEAVKAWYERCEAMQPVDLIVINAGIFDGNGEGDAWESADEARQIIETNLTGVIHAAQPAMLAMRARRGGHIAIVSSLAAILPAADAPSYSASKAGLVAYCDAVRMLMASYGVRISVILPGHVRTAQTDVHAGPLAMMLEPDKAAAIIKQGLDGGKTYIAFPRRAHWLVRLGSVLPWRLKALATRSDRFHVRKTRR